MGDRGNIIVLDDGKPIYLYAHWSGSDLPDMLQKALTRRKRWTDSPYLTRIIFDQMTAGSHGQETGFGICTSLTDNEHPLIVVDVEKQEVRFVAAPQSEGAPNLSAGASSWSFEDYCKATSPELSKAFGLDDE